MRRRYAFIAPFLLCLLLAPAAGAIAGEVLSIGHRGAAGLLPENTLAAFRRALELGVDAIEMDIHLTADGRAAVHHDHHLKPETTRRTDGRWLPDKGPAVQDLTLERLRMYDVGRLKPDTRYARRYPDQQPADGERVPTLEEVIALAGEVGTGATRLLIEIKTTPLDPHATPPPATVTDAVVRIVRKAGIAGRTVILSFDWRVLQHAQKVAPEIPTSYLSAQFGRFDTVGADTPGPSPWLAGFDVEHHGGSLPRAVKAAGGAVWSPHFRQVSREQIAEAHGLGLDVVVWTADDPMDMRRLVDMGVDGITTNRPDVLNRVLGR